MSWLMDMIAQFTNKSNSRESSDDGGYDINSITKILDSHKNLNFVDRILNKDKYPILKYDDQNYATHKMSYASTDNGFMVYPNVIQYPGSNKLVELSPRAAMNYAIQSGEYIPFKNEKEAEDFSKNYKKVWSNK